MTSRWRGRAAATALCFYIALAACGPPPDVPAIPRDGPILLRMVPPEGQVSRYAYSMETSAESPMMPSTGPVMTMRFQITQTVLSVDDEIVRVRGTVDSTDISMAMPMPGMGDLPDFSGSVLTTEMDTRGRMLGLIESEGLPDLPDETGLSLETMFGAAEHFVLPEGTVSLGDTWTIEAPLNVPMGPGEMSMNMEFNYTFTSLDGSLATLSFEGPFDMDMVVEGMGMSGSGTMTGTTVVDLVEGRYVSQASEMTLDMSVAGMTMKVNTTTTTELLPDP